MSTAALYGFLLLRASLHRATLRLHLTDERGEGVISAAIAVLVMALLGALMWGVFHEMFESTTKKTSDQVKTIGS